MVPIPPAPSSLSTLYLEVSDILDIHIYSYHGNIRLYPDIKEMMIYIPESYKIDIKGSCSYYIKSQNTIYVSLDNFNLGVLGHEIAHVIISHYFVVPPPHKIQEVLAGYVDYSLRKSTGTLP